LKKEKRKTTKRSTNNKSPKKDENFQWKKATRTLTFWLIIIVISIWFSQKFTLDERNELAINYSRFKTHLENKEIKKAFIEDKAFHGELQVEAFDQEKNVRYTRFKTTLPEAPNDETAGMWSREYDVVLEFKAISIECR